MNGIAAILVVGLLPLKATAPSSFQMSGFVNLEACEYARAAVTKQHAPFGKQVVLWAVCVPNGPSVAAPHQ